MDNCRNRHQVGQHEQCSISLRVEGANRKPARDSEPFPALAAMHGGNYGGQRVESRIVVGMNERACSANPTNPAECYQFFYVALTPGALSSSPPPARVVGRYVYAVSNFRWHVGTLTSESNEK